MLCAAAKRKRERGGSGRLFSSLVFPNVWQIVADQHSPPSSFIKGREQWGCVVLFLQRFFSSVSLCIIYIYIISKEAGGKSREKNESEIFASASLPALPHRQASKGALRGLQEESEA